MERILETIDDEVDLYHLELMAPLKARSLSKKAWERLANNEAMRLTPCKKWRPFESILTDADFCLREKRLGNISVRSVRGRDFARHASFTAERAREARILYTKFRDEADDFQSKSRPGYDEQRQEVLSSPHWQQW
ncbi:MAG: hypothetical protein SGARI_001481, partial [Bacillariaceae sp.]